MVNGVIQGQGRMIWKNGDRYGGSFKNGLFHGQGLMVGVDGSSYEGQFAAGAITGIGTMIYSDDEEYTGEFQYSRKHGKGILKSFGTEYQGDFLQINTTAKENSQMNRAMSMKANFRMESSMDRETMSAQMEKSTQGNS